MFHECLRNFSTEDLRDVGLLASSDARDGASGGGGSEEKRPYAKLYGMVGSSYEDVDIDDGLEDVGADDAYAIASKAQSGGYSKTAPPRAGGKGAKKKGPKKRQSIKRKKDGGKSTKAKKSAAKGGDDAGASPYGWGGVQVDDNPLYTGGGDDEEVEDEFAGFGDAFDADEAAANLDSLVGSPGADTLTGDDGYEMPVGSAGYAGNAPEDDGYEIPVGSAGYVPGSAGAGDVEGYGVVKPMRPRHESIAADAKVSKSKKKGMGKKTTSQTNHVAVTDIYETTGGGGGGGDPGARKRSQTDAGSKASKGGKSKSKSKDSAARPRAATAASSSKVKKKKGGGGSDGGRSGGMPSVPNNMADNFLATLKRK